MNSVTFGMIKPDAVKKNYTGKIIDLILNNGFKIRAMKLLRLTTSQAEKFYFIHHERPFYRELVEYITSGPVVAMVLEKDNAVQSYRNLLGATDPKEAAEGTIRKLYGESKAINAIHGSDSDENAQIEISFMFNQLEYIDG
ncbi:MAG TPA: nucleoside-diphosphate kinase [Bacteroidetes bacterium]|nr:nucleoside-diphosphate kinase [Bacteroidota bacterium]